MLEATQATFQKEVLESDVTVLVDFWAAWCGPCRAVAPVLERIENNLEGRLKLVKINVDENPSLAALYDVMSIPTMLVIKNGKIVEKMIGALPQEMILNKIKPHL